jgi:hypothetical protein
LYQFDAKSELSYNVAGSARPERGLRSWLEAVAIGAESDAQCGGNCVRMRTKDRTGATWLEKLLIGREPACGCARSTVPLLRRSMDDASSDIDYALRLLGPPPMRHRRSLEPFRTSQPVYRDYARARTNANRERLEQLAPWERLPNGSG